MHLISRAVTVEYHSVVAICRVYCIRVAMGSVIIIIIVILHFQPSISKLEGLLSNFHSPPKMAKIKGGSVKFSEQPPEKVSPVDPMDDIDTGDVIGDHVTLSSDEMSSDSLKVVKIQREFIKPAVCLVCAKCIAAVSEGTQEEYSRLLTTLVRLYCADSSFPASLYRYKQFSMSIEYSPILEKGATQDHNTLNMAHLVVS